jgi:hypothetical protein
MCVALAETADKRGRNSGALIRLNSQALQVTDFYIVEKSFLFNDLKKT